ncbi:hypothetical protein J4E86_004465 [Alternaria arbusti]|uniref:uncharacterized protein n=1 Tax=Alternaria arbusti TaxID=232088 RepID=UPI00221F03C9|nr:uncharacterized protein J4E86_004465 [Alternaria arbusti]KAI4958856.1 hypothetical protein J4E86_004465 [Alternaria arbusti]
MAEDSGVLEGAMEEDSVVLEGAVEEASTELRVIVEDVSIAIEVAATDDSTMLERVDASTALEGFTTGKLAVLEHFVDVDEGVAVVEGFLLLVHDVLVELSVGT